MRQAVGGSTRKQLADAALRGQILAMREQRAAAGPAAERRPAPGSAPRPAAGAPAGPGAAGARAAPGARAGAAGAAAPRPPPPPRLGGAKRAAQDLEDDLDDGDDDGGSGDWRAMLRAVTGGYDPSRCACTPGSTMPMSLYPLRQHRPSCRSPWSYVAVLMCASASVANYMHQAGSICQGMRVMG